ncbi:hypothetical protein PR048_007545, partial [Dryococelus australis]
MEVRGITMCTLSQSSDPGGITPRLRYFPSLLNYWRPGTSQCLASLTATTCSYGQVTSLVLLALELSTVHLLKRMLNYQNFAARVRDFEIGRQFVWHIPNIPPANQRSTSNAYSVRTSDLIALTAAEPFAYLTQFDRSQSMRKAGVRKANLEKGNDATRFAGKRQLHLATPTHTTARRTKVKLRQVSETQALSSLSIGTAASKRVWSSAGMKGWRKRELPEETRRLAESPGTIPTSENPGATQSGIEPCSPWREASALASTPPRLPNKDETYINRIRLERGSQKQSSYVHKTPYDRVKRSRERKINTTASERVNTDVIAQKKKNERVPQHSQTQFCWFVRIIVCCEADYLVHYSPDHPSHDVPGYSTQPSCLQHNCSSGTSPGDERRVLIETRERERERDLWCDTRRLGTNIVFASPCFPTRGMYLRARALLVSYSFRYSLACATLQLLWYRQGQEYFAKPMRVIEVIWSSAGMNRQGGREIPEKTRRPVKSSGTIPTCENPGVIRPGIEPGEQANRSATAAPSKPMAIVKLLSGSCSSYFYHYWIEVAPECQIPADLNVLRGLTRWNPVRQSLSANLLHSRGIPDHTELLGARAIRYEARPQSFAQPIRERVGPPQRNRDSILARCVLVCSSAAFTMNRPIIERQGLEYVANCSVSSSSVSVLYVLELLCQQQLCQFSVRSTCPVSCSSVYHLCARVALSASPLCTRVSLSAAALSVLYVLELLCQQQLCQFSVCSSCPVSCSSVYHICARVALSASPLCTRVSLSAAALSVLYVLELKAPTPHTH